MQIHHHRGARLCRAFGYAALLPGHSVEEALPMQFVKWITALVVVAVVVTAVTVRGQVPVQFTAIDDAVEFRFFDVATSRVQGNKLIIGLNTGRDPATWLANDFRASTAAFSRLWAMDAISFNVKAPSGYYITKMTYTQRGTGSVVGTGKASGQTTWLVDGFAYDLGAFTTKPTRSKSLDLTRLRLSSVPVSITTTLSAYATPTRGSASVSITGAELLVEVAPK
jgi:hypothetical protein